MAGIWNQIYTETKKQWLRYYHMIDNMKPFYYGDG